MASGRPIRAHAGHRGDRGRGDRRRRVRRGAGGGRSVGDRAHAPRNGRDRGRDGPGRAGCGRARGRDRAAGSELPHPGGRLRMTRVVQKYGGSSVATPIKLRRVARRIRESMDAGAEIVVVVSAMGAATDGLMALAHRVTGDPPSREMDMLLSSGETITAPLLAMALHAGGTPAISLTGAQAGVRTSRAHRTAGIVH